MATEKEKGLMVAAILRSRMHCSKNASVAVGVLYALGQFSLAAKFAHDYECVGPAGQFAELHGEDGLTATRRRRALATTQALIDRVIDLIESAGPDRGCHAGEAGSPGSEAWEGIDRDGFRKRAGTAKDTIDAYTSL